MGNVLAFPSKQRHVDSLPAPAWRNPVEFDSIAADVGRILADRAAKGVPADDRNALQSEYHHIRRMCERAGLMGEWVDNFVRVRLCVASTVGLTSEQLGVVVPELREMAAEVDAFHDDLSTLTHSMRKLFAEQVLGRGTPWTPWIKRNRGVNGKRIDKYAEHVDWMALHREIMADAAAATEGNDHA